MRKREHRCIWHL